MGAEIVELPTNGMRRIGQMPTKTAVLHAPLTAPLIGSWSSTSVPGPIATTCGTRRESTGTLALLLGPDAGAFARLLDRMAGSSSSAVWECRHTCTNVFLLSLCKMCGVFVAERTEEGGRASGNWEMGVW